MLSRLAITPYALLYFKVRKKKMSLETEITIICKVGDFTGFKEASSVEEHEQLELNVQEKGTIRVRKTSDKNGTYFEVTTKLRKDEGSADIAFESTAPVTSHFMENFREMAETLKIKTRYIFNGSKSIVLLNEESVNLPPVKYEVDVFKRFDGKVSDWCKIDIELDDFLKATEGLQGVSGKPFDISVKVTHLPFKPQEAFIIKNCTDEQKKLLEKLWVSDFNQTPFGASLKPVESSTVETKTDERESNRREEVRNDRRGNDA